MKSILLTFDLEEFDLPLEFNQDIDEDEMYKISGKGLFNILKLLKTYDLKATFFTTTNFANNFKKTMKELSETYEIASHGYSYTQSLTL